MKKTFSLSLLLLFALSCLGCGGVADETPEDHPMLKELQLDQPRDDAQTAQLVAAGRDAFERIECGDCHDVESSDAPGESLAEIYGKNVTLADGTTTMRDRLYLFRAIVTPSAEIVAGAPETEMPTNKYLTADDVLALIFYVSSLTAQPQTPPPDGSP
jgi:cytochrome c5